MNYIVPLSKGGKHSYDNTQPAHPKCNIQKGAKEEVQRIQRRKRKADRENPTEFRIAIPSGRRNRRSRGDTK